MAESVKKLYTKLNQLEEGDTDDMETRLSEDERALVSWTVQDFDTTTTSRKNSGTRKKRLS